MEPRPGIGGSYGGRDGDRHTGISAAAGGAGAGGPLAGREPLLAALASQLAPGPGRPGPLAAVYAVLSRAQAGSLVVFHNVPDLASVEAFLPPAGPGRVLTTSQSQHWPPGWAVMVPVLDPDVAARFLTARTGETDRNAALELARELGGLPLALEQGAAYMQATGTTLARYLSLFRGGGRADAASRLAGPRAGTAEPAFGLTGRSGGTAGA